MPVAKLFTYRGLQAVSLPGPFRFEGTEVHVRRLGDKLVLSARSPPCPVCVIEALMAFESGTEVRRDQPPRKRRQRIR